MTIAHTHLQVALDAIPTWAKSITVKKAGGFWLIHCYR